MLLCNCVFPSPLLSPLSLPSPASAAIVFPVLLTSAFFTIIAFGALLIILIIVVVHLGPGVAAVTSLALWRRAGSIAATPVAALVEGAKRG